MSTDHCFAPPAPRLPSVADYGWAVFDDTAHSPMTNGWLRHLSGETGILAAAPTVSNSAAAGYPGDSLQRSSFYGVHIEPSNTASATGWNVADNLTATASCVYRLSVSDKTPPNPTPSNFAHMSRFAVGFRFLDCLPDIRNLAFIDNIAQVRESPSQSSGFAAWDAAPSSAATWYYPAASADSRNRNVAAQAVTGSAFPHPTATAAEPFPWELEYHRQEGELQTSQLVAALRVLPDVTADIFQPNAVAAARRVCGTAAATVIADSAAFDRANSLSPRTVACPTAAACARHNIGLVPYAAQGQPLVFWTEHWCEQAGCEQWQPCDVTSQPADSRCYDPAAEHPVPVTSRADAGTFGQWNWPDSRFPDHNDGDIRLDDHEMVFANIRVYPSNSYLRHDLEEALEDSDKRPWLSGGASAFECGQPDASQTSGRWICFSIAQAGDGVDQFEWLSARAVRVGVQYTLPIWGNVLVSTLERTDPNARGAKIYPVPEVLVPRQQSPY